MRCAGGRWAQAALRGVNAAVVGLLLAALYSPVWTAGITRPADFALAIAAFLLLFMWQTPPWLVVILCALGRSVDRQLLMHVPVRCGRSRTGRAGVAARSRHTLRAGQDRRTAATKKALIPPMRSASVRRTRRTTCTGR